MQTWKVYALCLLFAVGVEVFLTFNTIPLRDGALSLLEIVFEDQSIFATEAFGNSVFRSLLGVGTSCVILIPALLLNKSQPSRVSRYFRIKILPVLILCAVFFYLNNASDNGDKYIYALLSYASIILMLSREHLFFFTQEWFAKQGKGVLPGATVALVVFIILHPLVFSQGRILGTLLMVNLWIYTVSEKNLWMGIAVHAVWNFVLPQSAEFHYLVFFLSCFLAFGRTSYPKSLLRDFHRLPRPMAVLLRTLWQIFSYPNRVLTRAFQRKAAVR
ncbi:MAG: hypothetical protein ACRBB0_04030 [Pelagimonas sp.]|uniref:hypothetical protein n=1 Tax=Pelagimonas sp. TaxID=2073170 RepID=UPI003D6A9BFF